MIVIIIIILSSTYSSPLDDIVSADVGYRVFPTGFSIRIAIAATISEETVANDGGGGPFMLLLFFRYYHYCIAAAPLGKLVTTRIQILNAKTKVNNTT